MSSKGTGKCVALIGPILPFRGGIAQHTTMLHRALQKQADVLTISFTRQYPTWLFPGESDRDPGYDNHVESGVEYLVDSINPLTWRKAITRILNYGAETVVIPWWTIYWTPCFFYIVRKLKKENIKIVFF